MLLRRLFLSAILAALGLPQVVRADSDPSALLREIESDAPMLAVAARFQIYLELGKFYETLKQFQNADRIYAALDETARTSPISEVVNSDAIMMSSNLLEDAARGGRPAKPDSRIAVGDPRRILSRQELHALAVGLRKNVIKREFANPDGGQREMGEEDLASSTGLGNLGDTLGEAPEFNPRLKAAIRDFSGAAPELRTPSRAMALAELLIRNHEGKREDDGELDIVGLQSALEEDELKLSTLNQKAPPSAEDLGEIARLQDAIPDKQETLEANLRQDPDWVDPRIVLDPRENIDFSCAAAALAAKEPVDSPGAWELIQRLQDRFVFADFQLYCPMDLQLPAREAANPPRADIAPAAPCALPEKLQELNDSPERLTDGSPEVAEFLFPEGDSPTSQTPEPPTEKDDACANYIATTLDIKRDVYLNNEQRQCADPSPDDSCFRKYRQDSLYLLDRNGFVLLESLLARYIRLRDAGGVRGTLETLLRRLGQSHRFDPPDNATLLHNRQQSGEIGSLVSSFQDFARMTWPSKDPAKLKDAYQDSVTLALSISQPRIRDLVLLCLLETLIKKQGNDLDFSLVDDG